MHKEQLKIGDVVFQKGTRDAYLHPIKVNLIKRLSYLTTTTPPKHVEYDVISENGKRLYHIQTVSKQLSDCWGD